ncbi:MAG TPA: M67 family metallopeptidase [Thermoplasmata archaeon]|nr:M67 family metallopeptidase [Thermoplasmata archaeon]
MKGVVVSASTIAEMRRLANAAYPEECCGFLLSPSDAVGGAEERPIVAVEPASNRSRGERRRRFVILPEELQVAESRAASNGQVISGFYHSHPDHPARPSVFDQEHAWPWYAYLILATDHSAEASGIGAFELDADRREFRPIALTIPTPEPAPGGAPAR